MSESTPEHAAPEPTALNATLVERVDMNPSQLICRVRLDEGALPPFEPGQFASLGLPPDDPARATGSSGLVKRPYSIASAPRDDAVEFFIRLVDGGAFTPLLWRLGVGDRLWMDNKAVGKFTLDGVEDGKDLLLVSTGTGISPFLSMVRHYRGQGRWRRVVMVNGVRIEEDLGYREELENLARVDRDVFYFPLCSREAVPGPWSGLHGHVTKALEPAFYAAAVGASLDPEQTQVFLCGNPAMIETVENHLGELGFRPHTKRNPGQIHKERYW